ncbi:hypothetical protein FM996_19145 [Methylosinus sporium]|uniref:Uncharacterized protein n=1 Tax=Methylosinus sporium TaxID=428 RepID=A0A549SDW9_METSR|nr:MULTISPECIES: hypothetical protein [Methylosinus]MBU3890435.1 hypothetical protein [Methylosinus sp. KRF6]TRL26649.1 hypothetical protein FM996_19145 [Methylosinus sporium]
MRTRNFIGETSVTNYLGWKTTTPLSAPPPAAEAQATARERAAESRIAEPELLVTEAEPPEIAMPTEPEGFCSRASLEVG